MNVSYLEFFQMLFRSNAGQHQDLWGSDRSRGQDDFFLGTNFKSFSVTIDFNSYFQYENIIDISQAEKLFLIFEIKWKALLQIKSWLQ